MKDWNGNMFFYLWNDFMHRICTDYDKICPGLFQALRNVRQHIRTLIPLAAGLILFNFIKIYTV